MDAKELLFNVESPMFELRQYFERANYTMQDVVADYFYMKVNPDDPKQHWMLAYEFKRNMTRAEIVQDALAHMLSNIRALEFLFNKIAEEQL